MRVLAVAQHLRDFSSDHNGLRRPIAKRAENQDAIAASYAPVRAKALAANVLTQVKCRRAVMRVHLVKHARIVFRLDDHGDACVVLGACADQRRAADVDILDAGVEIATRARPSPRTDRD